MDLDAQDENETKYFSREDFKEYIFQPLVGESIMADIRNIVVNQNHFYSNWFLVGQNEVLSFISFQNFRAGVYAVFVCSRCLYCSIASSWNDPRNPP